MTFLDTSEVLARIRKALPPGHWILSLANELAIGMASHNGTAETTRQLFSTKAKAHVWPGEIGILGNPWESQSNQTARFLLWLSTDSRPDGRRADAPKTALSNTPSSNTDSLKPEPRLLQLVLYPPPGRYRIEYWDMGDCHLVGVEIGTAAPLVFDPPDCGASCILLIVSLL